MPVEAVIRWHEEQSYDFVAITDHDRMTDARQFCEPQLVALRGIELSVGMTRGGGPFHLVAFGLPDGFPVPMSNTYLPQEAIDLVGEAGGLCFVAHPHWSTATMEELADLENYTGIEVSNTGCDYENRTGRAEPYWDDLLRRGHRRWGFATDDSHWRQPDHGGGWIMVKAEDRTEQALIDAIRAGHFYSSGGPTIEDITLTDTRLEIFCSPVESIVWTAGRRGWSSHAKHKETITHAVFDIQPGSFVRVQVVDRQGRVAWSNPLFNPE
ncbi:MAG: CehA/McbA family metallohydrolase [Herpetosiphon sp.]